MRTIILLNDTFKEATDNIFLRFGATNNNNDTLFNSTLSTFLLLVPCVVSYWYGIFLFTNCMVPCQPYVSLTKIETLQTIEICPSKFVCLYILSSTSSTFNKIKKDDMEHGSIDDII